MALFDRARRSEHQRDTYARGQPFVSGETVTPGRFRCRQCGLEHEVPQEVVTNLPVCPRCQHEYWEPA